jgi:hypothetical protein
MPISLQFDTPDQAPEPLRPLLAEREGRFVFEAEAPDEVRGLKSAFERLKEEQRAAKKQLDQYRDVDPEKYRALLEEQQTRAEKKLIEEGKVEELLNERIGRAKAEWDREKGELSEKIRTADEQLDRLLIDNEVVKILESPESRFRLAPGALEDVMLLARHGGWKLARINGQVVVVDADGRTQYSAKDPQRAMSIAEWVADLAGKKPHLFQRSAGAGTTNSPNASTASGFNKPFAQWTRAEKNEFIRDKGLPAFQQLIAQNLAAKSK